MLKIRHLRQAANRYQRVDYRPQNAYVKSKVYMAVDSENPRMYQCSRVFAFRYRGQNGGHSIFYPITVYISGEDENTSIDMLGILLVL